MSLLLNALKKAEEGEKKPEAEQASAAAPAAAPAAAAPASAPAAGGAPGLAKADAPAPAAEAAPVDFDDIEDEGDAAPAGIKPIPGAPTAGEKRARVDAARVFSAGEDEEGGGDAASGGARKMVYSLVGVVGLVGGVYFVLISGVIPGVDLRAVQNLIGLTEARVASGTSAPAPAVELEISGDVVLLPVPAVDIQSKVDFAALRLPENNRARIGEAEYMQRIAYLTGFDFDKERTRAEDEQRDLIVELDISLVEEDDVEEIAPDAAAANALAGTVDAVVLADRPIYTAEQSRADKLRLDSSTPSDQQLQESVKMDGVAMAPADANADADAAAQAARTAQVEVKESQEGEARKIRIRQAQALYNQGNYLEAEVVFRNVLKSNPRSRDALRGLAQIAVVTGRYQAAVALYLDLLGYYPKDPVAIAELTNLRGGDGDLYEMEKALKESLGKMPAADGRLYFSLGNLYAQSGRLRDAQQAYFEAFSRESTNPDYAYNLAVLLDHLNKPGLAVRYYTEALQLSQNTPVGFSRADVRARITDLQ